MKAVIERRDSRASQWSGRLAYFATILLIVAGLSHRYGILETVPFIGVLLIVALLAAAGLGFAFAGFVDLWERGDRGGRRALASAIVCCFLLAPYALSAWRVLDHPMLVDVATDLDDPPEFLALSVERPAFANQIAAIDLSKAQMIRTSYPNLAGRRYPVSPDRVMEQALALIAERGWTVAVQHGLVEEPPAPAAEEEAGEALPPIPQPRPTIGEAESPAIAEDETVEQQEVEQDEVEQEDVDQEGVARVEATIEVRAFSRWLRFPADVVLRLTDEGEATFVDMRSASQFAQHDLGDNADRVRRFLGDLDARMEPGSED